MSVRLRSPCVACARPDGTFELALESIWRTAPALSCSRPKTSFCTSSPQPHREPDLAACRSKARRALQPWRPGDAPARQVTLDSARSFGRTSRYGTSASQFPTGPSRARSPAQRYVTTYLAGRARSKRDPGARSTKRARLVAPHRAQPGEHPGRSRRRGSLRRNEVHERHPLRLCGRPLRRGYRARKVRREGL